MTRETYRYIVFFLFIYLSRGYDSVIQRMQSWVCLLYNLYHTHEFILRMTQSWVCLLYDLYHTHEFILRMTPGHTHDCILRMTETYPRVYVAKTKALISFAVTAKLICVFVFAYAKIRFSHNEAHIVSNYKENKTNGIELLEIYSR